MARLCERPGCSEGGAIAYGFDADRTLVWLAPLDPEADRNRAGTLCVRHADAMVVPLGWTLEDARDPMPRLFKPAARARPARPARGAAPAATTRAATKRANTPSPKEPSPKEPSPKKPSPEQLTLEPPMKKAAKRRKPDPTATVVAVTGIASSPDDPDATVAIPWMPEFDVTDDLGGTLYAETPLLARAFRGVDRPT